MNKKNIFLLIGIAMAFSVMAQDQKQEKNPYPDTLRLVTDSQVEVVFSFYEMRSTAKEQLITNELWKSVLNVMNTSLHKSEEQSGMEISYRKKLTDGQESVVVKVRPVPDGSDLFVIGPKGMQQRSGSRNEFIIYMDKMAIRFYVNNKDQFDEMLEFNIESVWGQLHQKYEENGKKELYKGTGTIKYGDAHISEISSKPNGVDLVELSAGVGLGYYADRFVPDVSYDVSFRLRDRYGNLATRFGLLYTQHYFVSKNEESEFDVDVNGFLSAYFAINTYTEKEYGIGFGYLINQSGDFYKGNTYKLTLYNKKSSRANLAPELVFTDGFKKAFPALRFGLSF